jgi:hypothetical protein
VTIRGLNQNHNHDLKNIFKGAATRAAATVGPFQKFYEARLASGMKPPMARLTLARKIAAITLLVWKKGVCFDAKQLKQQAAGATGKNSFLAGCRAGGDLAVLLALWFEGEYP